MTDARDRYRQNASGRDIYETPMERTLQQVLSVILAALMGVGLAAALVAWWSS